MTATCYSLQYYETAAKKSWRQRSIGSDDTLFALTDGYVAFQRKGKFDKQVSVLKEVTA